MSALYEWDLGPGQGPGLATLDLAACARAAFPVTYPHPADRAAADRFATDFLARAPDAPGALRPLLEALGGNSPFLADLALREPATLLAIDANGPDAVCDAALGALPKLVPTLDRAKIAAGLRQAKRTVALAASVADIGGAWDLESVTGALSDLAEGALRVATAHLLRTAHARGDLRLPHPAAPERGSGFSALAMGKLGARELNFSSDVDLILLYDPAVYPDQADTIGHVFTRLARDLVGLMEARDAGGYVFRVDLRLRPDPASTPPCIALPGCPRLLRKPRPDLGTRRLDQGPSGRRRPRTRPKLPRFGCVPSSGAVTSISPPSPTSTP